MTNAFAKVPKGLWNLSTEERKGVYEDLRQALSLSKTQPMVPLPEAALKALSQRGAELMAEELSKHPTTRILANREMMEGIFMQYGLPAVDEFFEGHQGPGQEMAQGGLPGLYLHALVNTAGLKCTLLAAREVLTPEQQALVLERWPRVMFLRHALLQEANRGAGQA